MVMPPASQSTNEGTGDYIKLVDQSERDPYTHERDRDVSSAPEDFSPDVDNAFGELRRARLLDQVIRDSDPYRSKASKAKDYFQQHFKHKPIPRVDWRSKIENAFRSWGLLSLFCLLEAAWTTVHERKRVAIFHDRWAAFLAAFLHLPPIIGTLVLTYFTFSDYYIGGELAGASGYDEEKFLGLQFAAKFQELFSLASLSTIVVTLVRRELALGEGVPLGSLSAAQQVSSASFLWSKELFAICTANFSATRKKLFFILMIIVCTVLGVSVAPAGATAMIPTLGVWTAGGTTIWLNTTSDLLFPSVLDSSSTLGSTCAIAGNDACPSAQWQTLSGEYLANLRRYNKAPYGLTNRSPSTVNLRADDFLYSITIDMRSPFFDVFSWNYSVACAPHIAVADAMVQNTIFWDLASRNSTAHDEYRFYYRQGEAFDLFAASPVTHTRCATTVLNDTSELLDLVSPDFPDFRDVMYPPITLNDTSLQDWMASTLTNISRPEMFWFDLPSEFTKNASAGVVIAMPGSSTESSVDLWGCMIDARYVGMTVHADREEQRASGQPQGFHIEGTSPGTRGWQVLPSYGSRAKIEPSFGQYLNPLISSSSNNTVFQEIATASGLWDSTTHQGSAEPAQIEAILNLMTVNGMARTAPYTKQHGELINFDNGTGPWWRGFMPIPPASFGSGAQAYNLTSEQEVSSFPLTMIAFVTGYAYSQTSTATLFSMIILLVYVGVATLFIIWSLTTGLTSSSWETPSELIALALNSPQPNSLVNTSAGFSSTATLRARFFIRAVDHQVQLVELDPAQGNRIAIDERVQPNVPYG